MKSSKATKNLVEQSVAGDMDAYGQLVLKYQSLACSVAFGKCGDFSLSEDIAQDAFVQAWAKLEKLKDQSKFAPWICSITRNLASRKNSKWQREIISKSDIEVRTTTIDSEITDLTPEVLLAEEDDRRLVFSILDGLPQNYRECLILYYRNENAVKDIAEILGIKESAVKQRLKRGREMLKGKVGDLVERGLRQSNPSSGFTRSVMVALSVTKSAGAYATSAAVVAPIAVGAVSAYAIDSELSLARDEFERELIKSYFWKVGKISGVFGAVIIGLTLCQAYKVKLSIPFFENSFYFFEAMTYLFMFGLVICYWKIDRRHRKEIKEHRSVVSGASNYETEENYPSLSPLAVSEQRWSWYYGLGVLLTISPFGYLCFLQGNIKLAIFLILIKLVSFMYGYTSLKSQSWQVERTRWETFYKYTIVSSLLFFGFLSDFFSEAFDYKLFSFAMQAFLLLGILVRATMRRTIFRLA